MATSGEPPAPARFPWVLAVGVALVTGVFSHARLIYQYGFADQGVLAIRGIGRADPTAFANDFFYEQVPQPHWTFDILTYVGERFSSLPAAYFLYTVASFATFGLATAILATRWLTQRTRWLALLVGPILVLGPVSILGSTTPVLPWAIPHVFGGCLAYLAIACLIDRRPVAATVATLLTALIHVQHGANLAVILLIYAAFALDTPKQQRLVMAGGGIAAALHAVAATRLLGITGNGDDFLEICVRRSPHHCDANSWASVRLVDGWYLAALISLLIWARRREDLRVLLVTAGVPLLGLLVGVWSDRLDLPLLGHLAQSTNVYRLVALLLPLAVWAPIVALTNTSSVQDRGAVLLACSALLIAWFGMNSALGDSNVYGGVALILSASTVAIIGLTAWTSRLRPWVPRFAAGVLAVAVITFWPGLGLSSLQIGLDQSDPRVQAGRAIESVTPTGSVIAASPSLTWVRFGSRRAMVVDCKAVPYGGSPWTGFKERIEALGGWSCGGMNGFATLALDDVAAMASRYGATHMLVTETDPKAHAAEEAGWHLSAEFNGVDGKPEIRTHSDSPLIPMMLFEIPQPKEP